jgi:hypothetical protein
MRPPTVLGLLLGSRWFAAGMGRAIVAGALQTTP